MVAPLGYVPFTLAHLLLYTHIRCRLLHICQCIQTLTSGLQRAEHTHGDKASSEHAKITSIPCEGIWRVLVFALPSSATKTPKLAMYGKPSAKYLDRKSHTRTFLIANVTHPSRDWSHSMHCQSWLASDYKVLDPQSTHLNMSIGSVVLLLCPGACTLCTHTHLLVHAVYTVQLHGCSMQHVIAVSGMGSISRMHGTAHVCTQTVPPCTPHYITIHKGS